MAAVGVYKIALGIEYRGARYRGFQRQRDGVPSIQASLEKALSKVAGGAPVTLSCAGRTDALVHASGQVVHFDTTVERSMHAWVMGANMNLPGDISVTWAKAMPKHFDARFCAMARRYRYVMRAYIDMGDSEGARDILDEVIAEGNEGQQQEARELIGKLV